MVTFTLRHFSSAESLQAVQAKYLMDLLDKHAAYFATRGVDFGSFNGGPAAPDRAVRRGRHHPRLSAQPARRSRHRRKRDRLKTDIVELRLAPEDNRRLANLCGPLDENLRRVAGSEHARFPVCRCGLDEVLGIVDTRQLLHAMLAGMPPDLSGSLEPAVFMPERLSGLDLLEQFRVSETHLMLVIDEYGEINGLVTLRDVLEALTGEFRPSRLEEAWAVQREDGSSLLDGLIPIPELQDRLGLTSLPDAGRRRYHTLSGLVMWLSDRLPQIGDVLIWENWRLEVVDLDGRRIAGQDSRHAGCAPC